MKRNLLLLSGIAVLSLSANAQELKEDYMVWPNSGGLPGYVMNGPQVLLCLKMRIFTLSCETKRAFP